MANAWRICSEMGIEIVPRSRKYEGPLRPRQTRSRATIKDVAETGNRIGYPDLVYDVLGLFLASPANERQLYGENIQGVARWLQSANLGTADVPFIRPAFSEIDMGWVRQSVLHYCIPMRAPQIAFVLASLMEPALEQIDLNRRQRA